MKTLTRETRPITPMTDEAKVRLLKGYAARAQHLLIGSAQETASLFEEAAKKENFEKSKSEMADLMQRMVDGDEEAQAEYQEMVIYSVDNYLFAQSNYVSFFETGTLAEGDQAWYENVEHFEVFINFVGQDGGEPRWQAAMGHSKTMVPFYYLTTGEMEYPIFDIYSGKIADRSKLGYDLAGDLNNKLDVRLFGNIQDLIGPFTLTGDKLNRVYVPHSRIKTANLPTTNLLVPADNTATSLFRKSCLDVIVAYCRSWGDNLFGDGPLIPTAVFVPSSHITGFLDDCAINDPDNVMNRQVFDFGIVMNYAGYKWMFVADPTLDPAEGLAYVKFNKPVGMHWTKPAGDKTIIDDSKALQKENRETMLMRKLFATAIPANRRMNIAAVQYRD